MVMYDILYGYAWLMGNKKKLISSLDIADQQNFAMMTVISYRQNSVLYVYPQYRMYFYLFSNSMLCAEAGLSLTGAPVLANSLLTLLFSEATPPFDNLFLHCFFASITS